MHRPQMPVASKLQACTLLATIWPEKGVLAGLPWYLLRAISWLQSVHIVTAVSIAQACVEVTKYMLLRIIAAGSTILKRLWLI
ncbi:unnamed protein product [Clonostachys byssicola]|uniref:Uncharacterized protein n=1 Tax=Clonostachys byssicola TaxID=160290 RepID=A0A9N9XW63_9HYPO|nr:unnamed protein product [Clonostachys byssicola]